MTVELAVGNPCTIACAPHPPVCCTRQPLPGCAHLKLQPDSRRSRVILPILLRYCSVCRVHSLTAAANAINNSFQGCKSQAHTLKLKLRSYTIGWC